MKRADQLDAAGEVDRFDDPGRIREALFRDVTREEHHRYPGEQLLSIPGHEFHGRVLDGDHEMGLQVRVLGADELAKAAEILVGEPSRVDVLRAVVEPHAERLVEVLHQDAFGRFGNQRIAPGRMNDQHPPLIGQCLPGFDGTRERAGGQESEKQ